LVENESALTWILQKQKVVFMDSYKKRDNPEHRIQKAIIAYLKARDWDVMVTHGNMYQQGFPDLYAIHYIHGTKWIEVKNPLKFSFTPAQRRFFPLITGAGTGIWILTGATDEEYDKLFKYELGNWHVYMLR